MHFLRTLLSANHKFCQHSSANEIVKKTIKCFERTAIASNRNISTSSRNCLTELHMHSPLNEATFNVVMSDINKRLLTKCGKDFGPKYLSQPTDALSRFPVTGRITPHYDRFMIPLVVGTKSKRGVYVWFVVDTGSPFTYLTEETLKILDSLEYTMSHGAWHPIKIQDCEGELFCQASKKHYKKANILGSDALRVLKLSILADWKARTFQLVQS